MDDTPENIEAVGDRAADRAFELAAMIAGHFGDTDASAPEVFSTVGAAVGILLAELRSPAENVDVVFQIMHPVAVATFGAVQKALAEQEAQKDG